MVAGLATLLYQMKPDLTGAEVVDLIMDGSARPEVFGDTLRVDSIMGLPAGAPTLYQLDAYGAMQELSRRYSGAPICGLDVFAAGTDVIIMRDTPESFQVTDATYVAPLEVSVAPGGRSLAVGAVAPGPIYATRFYSVDGVHQADSVGIIRVQFLEEDTAYFKADSVRIGGTGSFVQLAGSGITQFVDPFSASVSPEGTDVIYVTTGQRVDTLTTQLRLMSNLGGTPVASVLMDTTQIGTWSSFVRFMGTSWTDFGDKVVVSKFLEIPDVTEYEIADVAGLTRTSLGTIGAEQARGRAVPGSTHFKTVSVQGSDCMLQSRALGTGVMVDSVDITADVPSCWAQGNASYNRGLAPPRVPARPTSGGR